MQDQNEQARKRLVVKSAIRMVQLDKVQFDETYQRDVKAGHRKIVAGFRQEALGTPLIGEREDGSLWGVDGRQRITALIKLGKREVRAEVFASRGSQHEAEVFKAINLNRTKLNNAEQFKARLAANDEQAHELKKACEECGYTIVMGRSPRESGANQLTAISTMVSIQEECKSVEPIKFALRMASRCWPGDRLGIHNSMIMGLSLYYRSKKGIVDEDYLFPRLARATPHKILYAAGQATIGNNLREAVRDQIEKLVKKRLMKK